MMSEKDPTIASFGYGQLSDDCDNLLNKWTVTFTHIGDYDDIFK